MADALFVVVTGRFAVTRRRPPRGGGRARRRPAAGRDRLPRRRSAHRDRHRAARQPGAAAGTGRVRGALRQEPVDLAHADRGARQARGGCQRRRRAPPPDPRPRTVAIIRAGGSELPPAFIVGLTRAFRRSNRTMLVRPEMAKAVLPTNVRIDSVEATRALNALESNYDYVLYHRRAGADALVGEGDPAGRPRACRRHALGRTRSPMRSSGWRPSCCRRRRSASCCCTRRTGPSPAPRAGSRTATSPCTITWRWTTSATWSGSTASSTARRSAWWPAAAAPTARPTSASTRR